MKPYQIHTFYFIAEIIQRCALTVTMVTLTLASMVRNVVSATLRNSGLFSPLVAETEFKGCRSNTAEIKIRQPIEAVSCIINDQTVRE